MNPKCTLPEEKRRDALRQFDSCWLTNDEEEQIRGMFPQYLFFRNEYEDDGFSVSSTPVRFCTCTSCGESFGAVRGNNARGRLHHEKCNCPQCHAQVEGIAVYKYRYDMKSLESWVKTAVARPGEDGALLVEAGNARRRFSHDNLTGDIDWYPVRRYYFSREGVAEWKHETYYEGCHAVGWDWIPTKTVGDPFQPNMNQYAYDGEYSVVGLGAALPKTALQYCQILKFYEELAYTDLDGSGLSRYIVKYLAWYCIHPQIEMAVKLGFAPAVEELIRYGRKNAALLDWRAENPAGFLRMSAQEAKTFLRAEMDFEDLKDWKSWPGLPLRKYLDLIDTAGGKTEMHELMLCIREAGCTPEQGANYIRSLSPACARYAVPTIRIIREWRDYLGMARQLGYDLTVKSVAMPKELRERHDRAAETVQIRQSETEMRNYRNRRRMLEKKYAFPLGELCILVPAGSEEIIREGKTLHHCVGGYAARHIEGKTTILFLRKRRTPGRSFLTIEMKEERGRAEIRQIHGYRNEGYSETAADPREKYAWFLETWLNWVNSGSERDRQGKPVLPESEQTEESKSA